MEHIYFEVQLCINISNFREISNIDILIILALGTSLHSTGPGECLPVHGERHQGKRCTHNYNKDCRN